MIYSSFGNSFTFSYLLAELTITVSRDVKKRKAYLKYQMLKYFPKQYFSGGGGIITMFK